METFVTDIRMALRQIRRRPIFTLVAALSLGIGVGANTAIFNAVSALLLRPVPGVARPDRVVELGRTQQGHGFDTFAYPDYEDLRDQVSAFQSAAAYRFDILSLSRGEAGERITGIEVTPSYFTVMGVRPALGRFFTPAEDEPGSRPAVAVLSHAFWVERMGADPGVLGRTLRVDRVPVTVVGVAPADFHGHTLGFQPAIYLPLRLMPFLGRGLDEFDNRYASWHMAVARLADGATVAGADAQVKAVYARLVEAHPQTDRGRGGTVVPLGLVPGAARAGASAFLAVLMGMVALILLVTCANVAGMFLARAATREKEIAVRLALGAGRGRVVGQLLTEALMIFLIGGATGGFLGAWVLGLVPVDRLPVPIDIHLDLSPDPRVLAFAVGITLFTGVLFGLLPALQATRLALVDSLKDEHGHRVGTGRLRRVFVAGQVGLSLVLLTASGLMLRSLQRAARVETGFDPRDAYVTQVDLSLEGYAPPDGMRFAHRLEERLAELPGADAVGLSTDLPLDLGKQEAAARVEGWSGPDDDGRLQVAFNYVSPGYFDALRIHVRRGRDFLEDEVAGTEPVAVVSRTFAERVWPDGSAVGKRLQLDMPGIDQEWRTVVGVVDDVKNQVLTEGPEPFVYIPLWQAYRPSLNVLVHARGGMAAVAPALRRAILEVDGSLALTPVLSLKRYTGLGILPQRVATSIASVLGLLALLLAGIGIYGVVAVGVAQRTREIGVRMALGAGRRRVLALILRRGLALALPGLAVGGLIAVFVARFLRFLLLGLSPGDPIALLGVACALLAVVLVASLVPARRAAAVEPVDALRSE